MSPPLFVFPGTKWGPPFSTGFALPFGTCALPMVSLLCINQLTRRGIFLTPQPSPLLSKQIYQLYIIFWPISWDNPPSVNTVSSFSHFFEVSALQATCLWGNLKHRPFNRAYVTASFPSIALTPAELCPSVWGARQSLSGPQGCYVHCISFQRWSNMFDAIRLSVTWAQFAPAV